MVCGAGMGVTMSSTSEKMGLTVKSSTSGSDVRGASPTLGGLRDDDDGSAILSGSLDGKNCGRNSDALDSVVTVGIGGGTTGFKQRSRGEERGPGASERGL